MAKNPLEPVQNPLADVETLDGAADKESRDLIYRTVMRGGGEPFGAPFSVGVATLTDKIVKLFSQKSFFGFETLEKTERQRNKFTRYGASRFFGDYRARRAQARAEAKAAKNKKGSW